MEILVCIIKILLSLYQNFDKMSLGSKVRNYRYAKDLSQSTLADMVDVSQSEISSIESDKNKPNSVMLNRIAKALDVDINDLLVDDSIVQNNSDKAIGNIYSQVTINNHFPENVMGVILSNQEKIMNLQEKIMNLLENQDKLIESVLKNNTDSFSQREN